MKLRRLHETQKLFPLWLDRNYDSNFSKHLRTVNEQNLDIYNNIKKLEYARLLEKPIQIIKEQSEKYEYDLTFKVNIDNLKKITIWQNPIHEDVTYYDGDYQYNFKITSNSLIEENFKENSTNYFEDTINVISKTIVSEIGVSEKETIPSDIFLIKVETWDDYVFWKGYPENDTLDYSCNIESSTIKNRRTLTFTAFAKNIKTVTINRTETITSLESESRKITENTNLLSHNYTDEGKNRFRYVYRLDDDEANNTELWYKITEERGKEICSVRYTYSLDIILHNTQKLTSIYPKSSSDYDSLFDHDYSLDMIGNMLNVPRHKYNTVSENELDKTLPPFNNKLSEDDYYYQERIKYYINHYNRIYFPVLEMWKHYGIDSTLENRYKIIAQQDIAYQPNNKGITYAKEYNILPNIINCYIYYNEDSKFGKQYKVYNIGEYNEDEWLYRIDDSKNYYITEVVCINKDDKQKELNMFLNHFCSFNTDNTLKDEGLIFEQIFNDVSYTSVIANELAVKGESNYSLNGKTFRPNTECEIIYNEEHELVYRYKNPIEISIEFYNTKNDNVGKLNEKIIYRNDEPTSEEYDENDIFSIDFITPKEASKIKITLTYSKNNGSETIVSPFTAYNLSLNRLVPIDKEEYMRTRTNYNSCVYDLNFDYENIPSNLKLPTDDEFDIIFKRSFPVTKKAFTNISKNYNKDEGDVLGVVDKPVVKIGNYVKKDYRQGNNDKSYSLLTKLYSGEKYILSYKTASSAKKVFVKIAGAIEEKSNKLSVDNGSNIQYSYEFTAPTSTEKLINKYIVLSSEDNENFKYWDLKVYNKEEINRINFR